MTSQGFKPESSINMGTNEISIKDIISKIKEWYKFLLSHWILIIGMGILGGGVGCLYSFYKKPIYTASSVFVLEEASGGTSGLGQYAGLASMVGIDLGGGGGGIFQGDNLLELYKSRKMIVKTLLTPVIINGQKDLLVRRYLKFNRPTVTWNFKEEDKASQQTDDFNRKKDSLLNIIVSDINKRFLTVSKPDKKLSIIDVQVISTDEQFAKLFNDQIVKNVNDFYVQTKTKKSQDNLSILEHQVDSIKRSLNQAITGVASSIDVNPNANPSRQILRVPSQRRQVDVQANSAILGELVKNLEISKVSLRKETPLIQIIDEPVFPLERYKPGRIIFTVVGLFLSAFLTSMFLLIRNLFKNV
jgi:hypothetical protein